MVETGLFHRRTTYCLQFYLSGLEMGLKISPSLLLSRSIIPCARPCFKVMGVMNNRYFHFDLMGSQIGNTGRRGKFHELLNRAVEDHHGI